MCYNAIGVMSPFFPDTCVHQRRGNRGKGVPAVLPKDWVQQGQRIEVSSGIVADVIGILNMIEAELPSSQA